MQRESEQSGDEVVFAPVPRVCRRRTLRRRLEHVYDLDDAMVQRLWSDAESVFAQARVIKEGNRSVVARLDGPNGPMLLKWYLPQGLFHMLTHAWSPSRARWSWRMGWLIRAAGVRTPRPLAIVEERCGPLVRRAVLVTEFIDGRDLHQVATDANVSRELLDDLAAQLRELWRRLGAARITCDDIKANNFMIDKGGAMWLVDLDGARRWPRGGAFDRIFRRKRSKDRESFINRWVEHSQARELFAPSLDAA